MSTQSRIDALMAEAIRLRREMPNDELADRLTTLAHSIAAIKDEDYQDDATELFDGSDCDALVEAARRLNLDEYQRGRTAVRRELTDAVHAFNRDDSMGLGQLIEVIDPFLLDGKEPTR